MAAKRYGISLLVLNSISHVSVQPAIVSAWEYVEFTRISEQGDFDRKQVQVRQNWGFLFVNLLILSGNSDKFWQLVSALRLTRRKHFDTDLFWWLPTKHESGIKRSQIVKNSELDEFRIRKKNFVSKYSDYTFCMCGQVNWLFNLPLPSTNFPCRNL